jgi:hypothetical protein
MQAALAPSGYSGTPLPAKLGLKDGGPGFKLPGANPIPDEWRNWGRSAASREMQETGEELWQGLPEGPLRSEVSFPKAIAQALGTDRSAENPVLVGSCKTNFGHLEAAAGITGLIKVVLSLARGKIPPHLHFETPNPMLDWNTLPLRVTTALQDWPKRDGPSCAGVSSFGFSGTNAHVLIMELADRANPYIDTKKP